MWVTWVFLGGRRGSFTILSDWRLSSMSQKWLRSVECGIKISHVVPGVKQSGCRAFIGGSDADRVEVIENVSAVMTSGGGRVSFLLRVATGGLTMLHCMFTHQEFMCRHKVDLMDF